MVLTLEFLRYSHKYRQNPLFDDTRHSKLAFARCVHPRSQFIKCWQNMKLFVVYTIILYIPNIPQKMRQFQAYFLVKSSSECQNFFNRITILHKTWSDLVLCPLGTAKDFCFDIFNRFILFYTTFVTKLPNFSSIRYLLCKLRVFEVEFLGPEIQGIWL